MSIIYTIIIKVYSLFLTAKCTLFKCEPTTLTIYDIVESIETKCFNISDQDQILKMIGFELSKENISKEEITNYLNGKIEYFNSRLAFEDNLDAISNITKIVEIDKLIISMIETN